MAEQPSDVSATLASLVSPVNLLRVHSVPSPQSLMKMLNRTGPGGDRRDTTAGLQLDFVLLITNV